jgi:cellobiose-specific phosphotransferase system component IIC
MEKQEAINEVTQLQIEWNLKAAQMNLAHAEEQLALKKVRWYECVMFGGAGLTLGLALAKIFLDLA